MARAAVKAKQAQKAAARPKTPARARRHHKSGGNPTQALFFERMRRKAKFVYFLLAILFAITFAFLGVGSGSSGLSDLFTNINIFHHSGTSVSSAQKEIQKHPNAAKGYRDLATAYEGKAETASAITALQQYVAINKKDGKALSELAGLQLSQAADYQNQYGNAYQIQQQVSPSTTFLPRGKLGTALGTNPIEQAQASLAGQNASNLGQRMALSYSDAVATYQQLAKLQPNNANAQFQLGNTAQTAAQITGSPTFNLTAVAAYKAYLKLSPDASTAAQVRALIKQLQPAPAKKKK
jgi:predicted O-linked N-acetylglucosamine transferase (SPINDLY family)